MDTNTLRAIAETQQESQRVDLVKGRAESFFLGHEAAKKVTRYLAHTGRKRVEGNWIEFYAPFRDLMFMRRLGTWGLGPRGYQGQDELILFTGRLRILSANNVNHARIRMRYQ